MVTVNAVPHPAGEQYRREPAAMPDVKGALKALGFDLPHS